MRNPIPVLFAPVLLVALSLARPPQERTVGAPDSPIVIQRTLVGAPGTVLTADRGDILLIASSGQWGGAEDATAPPTVVTTTWVSGGATIVVTVTQGPNEDIPTFTRRVDATVRALQNLRPRDGPSTEHDSNH